MSNKDQNKKRPEGRFGKTVLMVISRRVIL